MPSFIEPQRETSHEAPICDMFSFFFDVKRAPPFPTNKVLFRSTEDLSRSYTYNQLYDDSRRFATGLVRQVGFQPGNVVAIVAQNDIDFTPLILGTWYAGGIVTLANPGYTASELSHQLNDSKASIVITQSSLLANVQLAAEQIGLSCNKILFLGAQDDNITDFKHWRDIIPAQNDGQSLCKQVKIVDPRTTPAILPYSSGTTGLPKGVVHSHHSLMWNATSVIHTWGRHISWNGNKESVNVPAPTSYDATTGSGGDRILGVLPLFHIYGIVMEFMFPLKTGVLCMLSSRFGLESFCRDVKQHSITTLLVVPPILLWSVKMAASVRAKLGQGWADSVRACICAAAPLPSDLIQGARETLGWRVTQAYGLSEFCPATVQDLDDYEGATGTVGNAAFGVEMKIVDEDNQRVADGGTGQVVLRGPNMFMGYLNNEKATAESITSDGWYKTGDVGHVEVKTGRLFISDRIKELIKFNGYQVAPAELEATLLACSLVSDVCVIGVQCPVLQCEVPRAYCVRNGGRASIRESDAMDVEVFMRTRLAKHKWLRGGVKWIDVVPKSASGKILRRLITTQEVLEPCLA